MNRLLVYSQKPLIFALMAVLLSHCASGSEEEALEEPVSSEAADPLEELPTVTDELPPAVGDDAFDSLADEVDTTEPEFMEEPAPVFAGASPVYFSFDDHSITPDAEVELAKIATYLKENPLLSLKIEGHCDERGTVEYNLALGEKRALSVKNFLVNLGVEDSRLTIVSYGEELPAVAGSDEFAWSQNRRVEFVMNQQSL